MASLLLCFAGGFLVGPMCGEPILDAVNDPLRLAIFTVLWYLMFYSPGDHFYILSKLKPLKIVMYLGKGLYYPKKVLAGMKHAAHVLPGNFLGILTLIIEPDHYNN